MSRVSRTAAFVALYRALETAELRRPPLFRDPFAIRFLPLSLRAAVLAARTPKLQDALARYADFRAPGARTSAIARTAFIDNVARRALSAGVTQVVILGAGYDTRAQRMPELGRAHVFEVDRQPTQENKMSLLRTTRSVFVPVDFLTDDAFARLASHGWNRAVPTLFIWEGVTNYLDEAAVLRVLKDVGSCAHGTSIVFTYVHRGVIDGSVAFEGAERILRNVRSMSEPWTFGVIPEELAGFVAQVGLKLREDLGADEYRARYLPAWENTNGYAFYRVAVAEVTAD
jgi:methyltransferase (TIGR00027 family)